MGDAVLVEGVDFAVDRQVFLYPCFGVFEVEVGFKGFEPGEDLLLVGFGSVFWDCVFDYYVAVGKEFVSPIAIFGFRSTNVVSISLDYIDNYDLLISHRSQGRTDSRRCHLEDSDYMFTIFWNRI